MLCGITSIIYGEEKKSVIVSCSLCLISFPLFTLIVNITAIDPCFGNFEPTTNTWQEEEVLLRADARIEEAARKIEENDKRQRELEFEETDRDAAEMAELMASDPEVQITLT